MNTEENMEKTPAIIHNAIEVFQPYAILAMVSVAPTA